MRGIAEIRNLIAHVWPKRETTAVAQFGYELAFQHIQHVAAIAPMIGEIIWRILDHPDAHVANVEGAPERLTGFARVRCGGNLAPIGDGKRQSWNFHVATSCTCSSRT